jgi:radical SAM superfamily enzyme YgiQ (UPF0313 family)
MKNVLMVYPEIPVTYWSFKFSMKFINRKSLMPPLGLLTVASLLPSDYSVKLVDMNVEPLTDSQLSWADIVFVSAMIVQKESFAAVINRCKEYGVLVAAGGPYPTSSYQKITGVDYFVLDEGEVTVPAFIRDYEKGQARKVYRAEEKPDISFTPIPRYELIDMGRYVSMPVQYSRGCPFSCEFCDIIELFGRIPRVKTVSQFLDEMQCIYDNGHRGSLFIVDDNFIGNLREVRIMLRALADWQKKHSYPFAIFTEASINLAGDDELMDLMVEAGFNMVFVGIETPDRVSLAAINKGQNLKCDVAESVERIQKKGLEVLAGFILGFDTDNDDIFDRQIEFIQNTGIPSAMIGLLTALPGTQLARRLEKEGRLISDSEGNNTNTFDMNFTPIMDKTKLAEGYRRVLKTIYSPRKYFERALVLISRTPKKSFAERKLAPGELAALFRSLYHQSFSRYGFHYLKFLVTAIIKNHRNFALAVNLAIKAHHLFVITDITLSAYKFSVFGEQLEEDVKSRIDAAASGVRKEKIVRRAQKKIMKKYRQMGKTVREYARYEYDKIMYRLDVLLNNIFIPA